MTDSDTDKTTLMVVDDSRLMRVAARKILKNDFIIIEAADGEEAWETLQQHPDIALVMSDLSMPNLDGLGLLKRIRESRFSELPVIIITGAEDDDGSKKTALAAGASDFITKPFESVQLLARAKAQARQKNVQEALQQSEAEKQQLQETSQVEPMTGLANKRAFINHLEENLAYATRHRTELSLILVRIEKYKVLFLRRGKQVAEQLAREVARILANGRRREDTVGHIALDTFGVLLPSANLPGSKRVVNQLTEAIEQLEISIEGVSIPFSVRFGLCNPDIRPGISADEVITQAETRLSSPPAAMSTPVKPATESPNQVRTAVVMTPPAAATESPQEPDVATPAEVQKALDALVNNSRTNTSADTLVRGILPILDNWNLANGQRYDGLVTALRTALEEAETVETATTRPQQPPELVD
ncbi:diguanylate cyclase (GGDEF)-like protein [Thiogranum longum]|uniref:Diguanylate cyclase (GGDEF)-like protein n=1 Tax=Thiogranum longum TaxID=1537524 RepID=A0A4R1HEP1_9GAMM|nr:response regulator [Thiogranum longum]TCK19191.1 diguanylate cyclase (GGDEF)-like protein [Thiogranum longum]